MKAVNALLENIKIPKMYKVKQEFESKPIMDIEGACLDQIMSLDRLKELRKGSQIAVAVGSRGIADIAKIAASVVKALQKMGFEPFIVSAMASHGRACAEGQEEILAELGIVEESVGCAIRASVDVVELGTLEDGLPVYIDNIASESDGIVIINRIKTHTAFHDKYESGLVKMLAIGLGNDTGANRRPRRS